MRLAICTPYPVNKKVAGGGAVIVRYLVEALQSQNIEVVLWLCREHYAPLSVQATPQSHDTPEYWEFIGFPPQVAFSLNRFAPQILKRIVHETQKLLEKAPIDGVLIFSPVTPGLWPMELAKSLSIPYALTLLDYSFICPTFTRYDYQGDFCQGVITSETCLKCSLNKIPAKKKPFFQILQRLPLPFKFWLGKKIPALFPATTRYHAGSVKERNDRLEDLKGLFKDAHAVIYQTPLMQQQFHQAKWQHHREYIECYGIPLANKLEKMVQFDDPIIQFVYLSRPTPEWGINFLLDTWTTYFQDKCDVHLTILSPNVLSLVANKPEWQNFKNVTFSEEMIQGRVAEFHSRFHILILPAQWQGIVALTSLEALAHGTVVIEPDLGGLSGYGLNENFGVKNYSWRDGQSLANTIEQLSGDRTKLSKLMKNTQQFKNTDDWGKFYGTIFQDIFHH